MDEIGQIIDYVKDCSGIHTDLIWGNGTDPALGDRISVTIIATGFSAGNIPELYIRKRQIDTIPLEEAPLPDGGRGTHSGIKRWTNRQIKPSCIPDGASIFLTCRQWIMM